MTSAATTCDVTYTSSINKIPPHTGLVLWPGSRPSTTYKGSITLEFSYFFPNQVVLGKNLDGSINYNWAPVETVLNQISANGHSAVLRFRYIDPHGDGISGVPTFIKQTAGYAETTQVYVENQNTVYYPDWRSTALQTFHKQFYTDLALKYDNDHRLAFLQFGFGHWGEYHIYNEPSDIRLGVNFPSTSFQTEFILHLTQKFVNTPVMLSIDAASDSYTVFAAQPNTLPIKVGLFDDSFMHKKHEIASGDGYNEECFNDLKMFDTTTSTSSRWKNGPIGGEISYYTTNDQYNFMDASGMYGYTFSNMSRKYHLTYMIANDAPVKSKNSPTVFFDNSLYMGYKFTITNISFQQTNNKITVNVKNTGVAPTYHHYYVQTVGQKTSTTSLIGLQPDETRSITIDNIDFANINPFYIKFTSPKVNSTITIPFNCDCVVSNTGDEIGSGNNNGSNEEGNSGILYSTNLLGISLIAIATITFFLF